MEMAWVWAVAALTLLVIVSAAFFGRSGSSSRRDSELRGGPRQFHWGLIATYCGSDDPTVLTREEAASSLNDWSCPDIAKLRRKIGIYQTGELTPAFDAARIAWLAELGAAAGWLTGPELAEYMRVASDRVRSTYRSWQECEADTIEGWKRWWPEIAKKPLSPETQARMARVRAESAVIVARIPWSA